MACTHERWEQIAAADGGDPGGCPICMYEEIGRLRCGIEELRAENDRLREACERALTGLYHHALCATQPPNHSAYCDCGMGGTQRLLKLALER